MPLDEDSYLFDLAFSPDGAVLAAGFDVGTVQLYRVTDGQELFALDGSYLEFSPDGSLLATMPTPNGDDQTVYVYHSADGSLLRQWEGQWAVFSPDGSLAVERDGAVRLMDVEQDIARQAFNGVSGAFSTDGQMLALLDRPAAGSSRRRRRGTPASAMATSICLLSPWERF